MGLKRNTDFRQCHSLRRNVLVIRRNAVSKLVDICLIVGAVVLIAAFEGVVETTVENVPDVSFDALVKIFVTDVIVYCSGGRNP